MAVGGDIIVSIDGREVSSSEDLANDIEEKKAGDTVAIGLERATGNGRYERKTRDRDARRTAQLGAQPEHARRLGRAGIRTSYRYRWGHVRRAPCEDLRHHQPRRRRAGGGAGGVGDRDDLLRGLAPPMLARTRRRAIAAALRRRVELCGVFVNAPLERDRPRQRAARADAWSSCTATRARVLRRGGSQDRRARDQGARRCPGRATCATSSASTWTSICSTPARRRWRGRACAAGTGETFDWALVRARRSQVPLILSGGLTDENVAEAIAAAGPYAVDSASGTEAAPGHKDPERLRAFFQAVERSAAEPARIGTAVDPAPRAVRPGAPA